MSRDIGTNDISNISPEKRLPKLIAFDLDGTIWTPDMYQLWGGGSPFTTKSSSILIDKSGREVRLLGIADRVLGELMNDAQWSETIVAWVSCTDEPDWAQECLSKFLTSRGDPIGDAVHSSQIFQANKQNHFQNLRAEYPHIDYRDMIFFDNEYSNIKSVSKLGVKCVYCPDGLTSDIWSQCYLP